MSRAKSFRDWARQVSRQTRKWITSVRLRGNSKWCHVCESGSKAFIGFGDPVRPEAMCPHCGSLERHRLIWQFLKARTNLFTNYHPTVLHVAPEDCFAKRLAPSVGRGYITADLNAPARVKLDIRNIQFPAGSFDAVLCSHVLEHVDDDKKAMREIRRILKPTGWALIAVPIKGETTFEDPTITDPGERYRVFGQADHVRIYGADFVYRLKEAGFTVTPIDAEEICPSQEERQRLGVNEELGGIFYCTPS